MAIIPSTTTDHIQFGRRTPIGLLDAVALPHVAILSHPGNGLGAIAPPGDLDAVVELTAHGPWRQVERTGENA